MADYWVLLYVLFHNQLIVLHRKCETLQCMHTQGEPGNEAMEGHFSIEIAYCLLLGLVRSTGPCSKSSAARMPSSEAMKCGLLGAGDTSSGAPPAKSP